MSLFNMSFFIKNIKRYVAKNKLPNNFGHVSSFNLT